MRTSQPVHSVFVRADQVKVGDRVSRRNYLREIVEVVHLPNLNRVGFTVDKGFGEVVNEVYPTDAEIELRIVG